MSQNPPPWGAPPSHYEPPYHQQQPPKKQKSTAVIVAIVLGAVLLAGIPVVGIVAAIAIPSLLAARRASNESAAVGNLRTYGSAQATHMAQKGRFGSIQDLVATKNLDPTWREGAELDSYRFTFAVTDGGQGFTANAEPITPSQGRKYYYIDEEYIIHFREAGRAGPGDKAIGIH